MIDNDEILVSQTDGIVVSAGPVLVDENESLKNHFMWGYYLCIENNSNHKIQLVGKDWNITDDLGNRYSDTSAGFKGELPELEPGEYFEFTSEAPLKSANAVFTAVANKNRRSEPDERHPYSNLQFVCKI